MQAFQIASLFEIKEILFTYCRFKQNLEFRHHQFHLKFVKFGHNLCEIILLKSKYLFQIELIKY